MHEFKIGDIIRSEDKPMSEHLITRATAALYFIICLKNENPNLIGTSRWVPFTTVIDIGVFVRRGTRAEMVLYGV